MLLASGAASRVGARERLTHADTTTVPSLLDPEPEPTPGDDECAEPDLALYPDLLLLVDAFERTDLAALEEVN